MGWDGMGWDGGERRGESIEREKQFYVIYWMGNVFAVWSVCLEVFEPSWMVGIKGCICLGVCVCASFSALFGSEEFLPANGQR